LRLAWERCIEEVLLNGAVQRFGESVSTQRLKSVVVTDEDYLKIEAGMSKSSKFEHVAARQWEGYLCQSLMSLSRTLKCCGAERGIG